MWEQLSSLVFLFMDFIINRMAAKLIWSFAFKRFEAITLYYFTWVRNQLVSRFKVTEELAI